MKFFKNVIWLFLMVWGSLGAMAQSSDIFTGQKNQKLYWLLNSIESSKPLLVSVRAGDGGPATDVLLGPRVLKPSDGASLIPLKFPLRIKITRDLNDVNFIKPQLAILLETTDLAGKLLISIEENNDGKLRLELR